ncbi:MAG: hypothetical protein M3Y87_13255 [Myxococcota bacterium]|nr:hypothetical protein [Myxococcota bacterium]
MRLAVSAVLALVLVGCGAEPVPNGDAGASITPMPRVQLGTGTSSFVELPETGGTVELVMGPQGGYHVDVAIRIWDLDPDRISVIYEVARVDGAVLSTTPFVFDPGRFVREGDHLVHTGDFTVLEITGPADVTGDEVELRVVATAQDGTTAMDARRATVVDEL